MKVILVPKDNANQIITLEDVDNWFHSHGCFTFIFDDDHSETYPFEHIWSVEQEQDS